MNWKNPEQKCCLFDVLPKQASNKNTSAASLHGKQWFYEGQDPKFKYMC